RGAAALMISTLALSIGATTAIFSVVYAVLMRPLPYAEPGRIMAVFEVMSQGRWSRMADPNFTDFRDLNHSFQTMAKYTEVVVSVSGASQPARMRTAIVSPDFLKVLAVQPVIGRDFAPGDAKKGAEPVLLVSDGYWKQYLGSSRDPSQARLKIE